MAESLSLPFSFYTYFRRCPLHFPTSYSPSDKVLATVFIYVRGAQPDPSHAFLGFFSTSSACQNLICPLLFLDVRGLLLQSSPVRSSLPSLLRGKPTIGGLFIWFLSFHPLLVGISIRPPSPLPFSSFGASLFRQKVSASRPWHVTQKRSFRIFSSLPYLLSPLLYCLTLTIWTFLLS